MNRLLLLALPAVMILSACTQPPDSMTRSTPEGRMVQLTEPRTCLDGQCVEWNARSSRANQPLREPVFLQPALIDENGYVTEANFRLLHQRTMTEPSPRGDTTLLIGLGFGH